MAQQKRKIEDDNPTNNMAQQKRKIEDDNPTNNLHDISDDEHDTTWDGYKTRYLYNFVLQSFDNLSNSNSDETESVYSYQSKTTMEAMDEEDISSSGSDYQNSISDHHTEYDVRSTSSSGYNKIDSSDFSDSSTVVDFVVTKDLKIYDETHYDDGYVPDTDNQQMLSVQKRKIPPPACFKTCVQCKKLNPNPFYQYCHSCFQYRMKFFESKPDPKPKNIKRFKKSETSFQELGIINIQQNSIKQSSFKKENMIEQSIEQKNELCNICFLNPKNGVFNHGKIGHIFCCYNCAKQVWTKTNKCPICNVKIKFVTKMITA